MRPRVERIPILSKPCAHSSRRAQFFIFILFSDFAGRAHCFQLTLHTHTHIRRQLHITTAGFGIVLNVTILLRSFCVYCRGAFDIVRNKTQNVQINAKGFHIFTCDIIKRSRSKISKLWRCWFTHWEVGMWRIALENFDDEQVWRQL